MPLRITLKPHERLIINGASIRNGNRSANFLFETRSRFLRESEILLERDADTPCKKLYVTLQVIHLSEAATEAEHLFFAQAVEVMRTIPRAAPLLAQIQDALSENETYAALKLCRQLVHECDAVSDQETAAPASRLAVEHEQAGRVMSVRRHAEGP